MTHPLRLLHSGFLIASVALAVGCGQLTIRTWVNVIEDESSGSLNALSADYPITRFQGGFLTRIQVDTRQLPGPLEGTAVVEDVRVASVNEAFAGNICIWNDPDGSSGGPVVLDLLGGQNGGELFLDAKGQTRLSEFFGLPPSDFEESLPLDLGSGLSLSGFLGALDSGSLDGLIATTIPLVTSATIGGFPVTVAASLRVTSTASPPLFDADLADFCGPYFAQQGPGLFVGVNPKSSFLLANQEGDDAPAAPAVIDLESFGIAAGDTLSLARVGTFSSEGLLRDGIRTRLLGVFSATDVVLPDDASHRVPDAIDAGTNVFTSGYLQCFLIFCTIADTDIPEDFEIDPTVEVVVPDGAQYLIVAPYDDSDHYWSDNSGFGLGVDVAVAP